MEGNTVNKKSKPQHIEGAAGQEDQIITTSIALQNNKPHKLEIEVTNSGAVENLPFMIEDGELISENDEYVVTRAKSEMSREEFDAEKARIEEKSTKSGEGR